MISAMHRTLTPALPTPALKAFTQNQAYSAAPTAAQWWKDPNRHRNSLM